MSVMPPLPADRRSEMADGFQLEFSRNPPHLPSSISHLPSPVRRNAPAFSLTEVVIALGIFAVSMVGVLALFPVASSAGRESSEETQAAILAQMIFSELRASAEVRGATNVLFVRGQNTGNNSDFSTNSLANAATITVAFDVALRDKASAGGGDPMIGPPMALKAFHPAGRVSVATHNYSNALTTYPNVTYLAQVRINPVPSANNLALVTVEASTPANVALTNRRVFSFSSLITGP